MKNGSKPRSDISTLRVFGSTTFYKVKGLDSHSKLKARARKAVLIGYTENAEVYKLWDIELRKVVYSRDVEILEGVFHSFSNSSTEIEILESKETESLQESESEKSDSEKSDSEESEASQGQTSQVKASQGQTSQRRKDPIRKGISTTPSSSRPSIIIEIPKKSVDYYREFKEVNLALLLSDENYPLKIFLTLGDNPKTFKQAV